MEEIINETVSIEELKKFEDVYHNQLYNDQMTHKAQFEYAWCLVRSKFRVDIKKGILLLEQLFKDDPKGKREYLYYLAIGNARIKEYSLALKYLRLMLSIEPGNQQVILLEEYIKKKMEKEGLKGVAVAGGVAVVVAGIVSLGIALARK